jgi:hypothetical protein
MERSPAKLGRGMTQANHSPIRFSGEAQTCCYAPLFFHHFLI